jgi:hypothetical protein
MAGHELWRIEEDRSAENLADLNILFDFNKGDIGTSWDENDVDRGSIWFEGATSTDSEVKGGRSGEGGDGPGDVAPEAGISTIDSAGEFCVEKENVKSRETSLKASKIVALSEVSSSEVTWLPSLVCSLSFGLGGVFRTLRRISVKRRYSNV